MDSLLKNTIKNLSNNGFEVEFFENVDEAKRKILEYIQINEDIGIGGSMTVHDIKLYEELKNRGNKVYWHWLVDPKDRNKERQKAGKADVYICSTNSITEDGKLINIDGVGNRVASMFYGHEKIIIIAGVNKIHKDEKDAIKRIKDIACPQNAKRLNLDTPCRHTGKCNDCNSPHRMCRVTVTIERNPMQSNIKIYLINKELGY